MQELRSIETVMGGDMERAGSLGKRLAAPFRARVIKRRGYPWEEGKKDDTDSRRLEMIESRSEMHNGTRPSARLEEELEVTGTRPKKIGSAQV